MADADGRGARFANAAAVIACVCLAAVYVTPHVLDADESLFAAIGLRMRTLGLPAYDGGWEHKPPAIFWTYEMLAAPWSRGGLVRVHAGMAAAWVATAVIAGVAARRLLGAAAFAPTVLAYALLRSLGRERAGAGNTEAFLSPFLALGLYLLVAPRPRPVRAALLGGAALGVAVLFKPPVALYGPAAVVAVAILRGPRAAWTAAWAGAAGAMAVVGATAAVLAGQGVLPDAWKLTFEANRVYMDSVRPTGLVEGLTGEPSIAAAPWILAFVGLAAAVARPRLVTQGEGARRWAAAIALLLATGLVAISLGGLFLRHYWIMVHPVLAVAAASGVVALLHLRPRWIGAAAIAAIVAAFWLPAQRVDKSRMVRSYLFDPAVEPEYETRAQFDVADAIRRHAREDEPVFVWGADPELHLFSERTGASRHVTSMFLAGTLRMDVRSGAAPADPDVLPGSWDRLWEDFRARPPKVFVDTSGGGYRHWDRFPLSRFPRLAEFVASGYDLAETVRGNAIWVRR